MSTDVLTLLAIAIGMVLGTAFGIFIVRRITRDDDDLHEDGFY